MATEGRFPAAIAAVVAISLLLAAVLMSAAVPGSLDAGALGGGGGSGMDLPGGGGGDETPGDEGNEGNPDGGGGDDQPGSGSPAREGRPGEGRRGPGATGTFDPTTVGDVPGPGHLTDGDGAVILSFTVESIEPHYFRFAAYDEYTGDGWRRTGDARPHDEGLPYPEGNFGASAQSFTAERPIAVMPAAWKPTSVDPDYADDTLVTSEDGLRPTEPFEPGDRYVVNSAIPLVTPAGLNRTGRDYPEGVETRYTQLPNGTPARVADLADTVTRDARTPYEETVAIGDWLRENKAFSLNATAPRAPVADAFLFEMHAGYCEYFATAMAAMLRSRGIPARYAVGYTPGPEIGEDTYYLYSAQSHAWVEVYFAGQGWVRFDPTPREGRLGAESRAFDRSATLGIGDVDRIEARARTGRTDGSGSSGPGGPVDRIAGSGSGGDAPAPTPTPTPSADYEVSLDRRPVPGATVVVTVTDDGEPRSDVTVLFNDAPVGVTDERGRVEATVPYDETLVVDVRRDGGGTSRSIEAAAAVDATALATRAILGPPAALAGTTEPVALAGTSGGVSTLSPRHQPTTEQGPSNSSPRTFELNTTADVRVIGPLREGASVTAIAAVEGVPVRNANVSVDGQLVGTTDGEGRLSMGLPYREAVHVEVTRGAVGGSRDLRLAPTINVSVAGLAIPGTAVTLLASRHGSPAGDAAVAVDGTRVGTTAADGTLRVALPLENTVEIGVRSGEARGTLRLGWLFAWFLLPTGGLVVLATAALGYRRYGRAVRGRAARLPALVRALLARLSAAAGRGLDLVVAALIAGAAAGARALRSLRATALAAARGLRSVARRLAGALRLLVSRFDSPVALARWLWGILRSLPGRALGWLRSILAGAADRGDDGATDTGRPATANDPLAALGVRAAWRSFVGLLPVDPRTRTPGELADIAVERGFPAGPVRRLTDLYRAVRYGGRDEDRRARRRARSALAAITGRRREDDR